MPPSLISPVSPAGDADRADPVGLAGPFLHPQALVDPGARVGPGTRVWAWAHVLAGAVVGRDCNLCDHTFIEGRVVVGDRVTLKCGVYLWDGLVLEDDVFVGPNATFANDSLPRSRQHPAAYPVTRLRQGCSIGAGAVVLPALTVGRWALVGAGAVVTRSVPDYALVVGNPARFRTWICRCAHRLEFGAEALARCGCGRQYRLAADGAVVELEEADVG
jgi:acetyltransferase-like isoleucine patch superfamily enzyme